MYFYVKLTAESKKKVSKSQSQALVHYDVISEKFGQIWVTYKRRREKLFKSTYEDVLTHLHEEWAANSIEKRTKGLWRRERAVLAVLGNFLRKMADSENTQSSAKRLYFT